jgi:hypothetical protein
MGAVGGGLVEGISLSGCLSDWQAARRTARRQDSRPLPALTMFVDVPADTLVALTRLVLGALAGMIFHAQIAGTEAAIAVGASAPAVLGQLGAVRGIREIVLHDDADAGTPFTQMHCEPSNTRHPLNGPAPGVSSDVDELKVTGNEEGLS